MNAQRVSDIGTGAARCLTLFNTNNCESFVDISLGDGLSSVARAVGARITLSMSSFNSRIVALTQPEKYTRDGVSIALPHDV